MKKILILIFIIILLFGCDAEKAEFDNKVDMLICSKLCQEKHKVFPSTSYYAKGEVVCYCDDAIIFERKDYERLYHE